MVRLLFRLGTCLVFFALLLVARSPIAHADGNPRVFAFYYAWYDDQQWSPNLISDIPAQQYVSSDPAAVSRQIDEAQGAGIDSFVVSWLGPTNPTNDRFKIMLDLAGGKRFSATIDFEAEQYGSRDSIIQALSYVRDSLEPHGAFARVNGKPIIFFWREQLRSVDDWLAIRQAVDPNHNQVWIAEGVNIAYQSVFDGHHLYSIAWSPDVNYTLTDWSKRVRRAGADKLWVATVMPGYDDTRTTRPDKFSRARQNGDFYRATWQAAIQSQPDLIIVDSFNEWVEGSMIEPSVTYGNLYLDITRDFAAQFKAQPPLSNDEKLALAAPPTARPTTTAPSLAQSPTATPPPLPTLTTAGLAAYHTTDGVRVRSGPGTTHDILARLPENFVLDVLARSEDSKWLAIAYPDAGSLAWISADYVAPHDGFIDLPVEPAPQVSIAPHDLY